MQITSSRLFVVLFAWVHLFQFAAHGAPAVHIEPSVFWFSASGKRFTRADLDGGDQVRLVGAPQVGAVAGIGLDAHAGHLYWVEAIERRIRRSSLDGTDIQTLVTTSALAEGFSLDLTHGKMYWAERQSQLIRRANLDGSQVETVVGGAKQVRAIALDAVNDHIYWTEGETFKIRRADLDGSSVTDLLAAGIYQPFALELDVANETIYWSEFVGFPNVSQSKIFKSDFTGLNKQLVASGLSQPADIVLEPINHQLWVAQSGRVSRIDLASGVISHPIIDPNTPQYLAVTAVPEPGSFSLQLAGALTLASAKWRRRNYRRSRKCHAATHQK